MVTSRMRFHGLAASRRRQRGGTGVPATAAHGGSRSRSSTMEQYQQDLEGNLQRLHARICGRQYWPRPVLRAYISKPDGGKRPLVLPMRVLRRRPKSPAIDRSDPVCHRATNASHGSALTRSELIAEIAAANPSLRDRDVTAIVNDHLQRDSIGHCPRRPSGAPRLWRILRQAPQCACGT
jgi:hypothetical protein